MKKHLLTAFLFLLTFISRSQTVLFSENFNSGSGAFTLNTTDVSSTATGYNFWVINNAYSGGPGSLVCSGFPFTFTVPATPNQPSSITGFPNSHYMHTLSDAAVANGISNCCFLAADGILCYFPENYFTRMTSDINTTGYDTVTLSFWWLCQGGNNSYGEVYYSTNGGTSWTLSLNIPKYNLTSNWTQTTIYDIAWANKPTLRIGFRFVNEAATAANDPGFGIDEIEITGTQSVVLPVVNFVASDTSFCEGSCIDFTDLSSNSPSGWQWNFPGATPSSDTAQNPTQICYTLPGSYDVTLIATNAFGSDTLSWLNYITVYANPPQPIITVTGGDTLCTDSGYTYQWYYNGSTVIPGATDYCYVAIFPGSYTVQITDSNGCIAISNPVVISGVNEINNDENIFTLYPNPSEDGVFYIDLKNYFLGDVELTVLDVTGRKLLKQDLTTASTRIDFRKNAKGVFFLQIKTGDYLINRKILVNK